jgi:hypothetical protein
VKHATGTELSIHSASASYVDKRDAETKGSAASAGAIQRGLLDTADDIEQQHQPRHRQH